VHLLAEAIRREDGSADTGPQLTAWWLADVKT
jgi:hypothetical protein